MSSRGSPSQRRDRRQPAQREPGAATRAWAYSTRSRTRLMKKRSTRFSRSARSRWSRNALTIVTLWARYHVRGDGSRRRGRTPRRWATSRARVAEESRARLAGVAQQAFVHRPPPRAPRSLVVERVEEATPQLPVHEGQRGALVPQVQGYAAGGRGVRGPEQLHPVCGSVADLRHALRGQQRRRDFHERSLPRRDQHDNCAAGGSGAETPPQVKPQRRGKPTSSAEAARLRCPLCRK